MAGEQAIRDQNHVTAMLFKGSDGATYNAQGDEITGRLYVDLNGASVGTVTSVSVVSANGFAGTVATATSTPAITISTTITGLLKGNGTAISAAVSGTDIKTVGGATLIGSGDVGTIGVGYGGTGLTSIAALSLLIANSANTFAALTPGAGNSIRINAGGTAWEAYTPSAGASGITIGTTTITSGTDTRILYNNAGVVGEYTLTGTGTVVAMQTAPTFATSIITPSVLATANDSGALGASGTAFSDLFLASGAVINFNAGASTLTHSLNTLTIGGSGATTLALGTNSLTLTGSIGATGARVTKVWTVDLESTNMPTVGGTAILSSLTAPSFATSVSAPVVNATTGVQINGAATSNKILKGNGTNFVASTETYAAPGTSGNIMTSDGTNWTSAAPAGGGAWTEVANATINGVNNFTISSLTGDSVNAYMIILKVEFTTADYISSLRVNADFASSYYSNYSGFNYISGSATQTYGGENAGGWRIGISDNFKHHWIKILINPLKTYTMSAQIEAFSQDTGTVGDTKRFINYGQYTDTSAQLTSLRFASAGGNNFVTGTEYWVLKLN